jgi:hypothetical protein
MKRRGKLMLLTGMALFGCTSAFGQTADQFLTCLDYGAAIGSFLNRHYQVPVRLRAGFGGRTDLNRWSYRRRLQQSDFKAAGRRSREEER